MSEKDQPADLVSQVQALRDEMRQRQQNEEVGRYLYEFFADRLDTLLLSVRPEPNIARLFDELEMAVFGKLGNTFDQSRVVAIEAFLRRLVTPSEEPERA